MKFRIGDVVVLKSDSPLMTVIGEAEGGDIICKWFNGSTSAQDAFPADALQVVPR